MILYGEKPKENIEINDNKPFEVNVRVIKKWDDENIIYKNIPKNYFIELIIKGI